MFDSRDIPIGKLNLAKFSWRVEFGRFEDYPFDNLLTRMRILSLQSLWWLIL